MEKNNNRNTVHILKAIASCLVWGLGQLFNRQYLKALFFFVFFCSLFALELGTGRYSEEISPYDKISGEDFSDRFAENFMIFYLNDREKIKYADFEEFRANNAINYDNLIKFIADDLVKNNPLYYYNILNKNDKISPENTSEISQLLSIYTKQNLFKDAGENYYIEVNEIIDGANVRKYVKANMLTHELDETIILENNNDLTEFRKTGEIYANQDKSIIYLKVLDNNVTKYVNLYNPSDIREIDSPSLNQISTVGPILIGNNKVYEYFEPGFIYNSTFTNYEPTEFSTFFKRYVRNAYNAVGNINTNDDYLRLLMRVSFEIDPDLKAKFIEDNYNFFYDRAGIFLRGYWEVITLGTTSSADYTQYRSLIKALVPDGITVRESEPIMGHVSVQVLLDGLIGVLLSFYFFIFMIWGAIDAYKTSKKRANEEEVLGSKEYFKDVYERGFEYIVLSPALFVLTFISIMPLLFGFFLAFTSISGSKSMIENFRWVGFENFIALFNFSSGFGSSFGIAFWRVLGWTIIWAILSTVTVFFGGFFQALILNSESVVFRKFWRTILILPWAIPALLSQMVFAVMFNEVGFVNSIMRRIGMYDLLTKLGMLGRHYTEFKGLAKIFYLGETNIQWFTNPFNPNFIKATIILVNIWLGFPYFMALMSGVMTAIDKSLYEAAEIDGATKFQQLKLITFPLVLYSTAPILIMTLSGNFNNFGVIYFITGGGPNGGKPNLGYAGDTDILISWMYKLTVDYQIYNMASVFSVLIFLFVGSVTAWNLTRTKAFKED